MVASVALAGHVLRCAGGRGYEPEGAILLEDALINGADHHQLVELARAAASCNDSSLHQRGGLSGRSRVIRWRAPCWRLPERPASTSHDGVSDRARTDAIAFDARHRFMATLHHDHPDHADIFVKGAPLNGCWRCARSSAARRRIQSLDEAYWIETSEKMAAQGHRVLAIRGAPGRHRADDAGIFRCGRRPDPAGPGGPDGSAAPGSHHGSCGMPRRRDPGQDDHRRPRRDGGCDREADRTARTRTGFSPAPPSTAWTTPIWRPPCSTPTSSPAPIPSTSCAWSRLSRPMG